MTAKLPIGWKALGPYRQSAIIGHRHALVTYPQRRRVGPRNDCGPLAVFKTLRDAEMFNQHGFYQIVRCWYVPSKQDRVHFSGPDFYSGHGYTTLAALPLGTILADYVTCLE